MIVSAIPTNSSDRQLRRDQIQPDLNEKNSSQIFPDTKAISVQDTCLDFLSGFAFRSALKLSYYGPR